LEHERDGGGFFEREIFRVRQTIHFERANEFRAAAVNHVAEVGGLPALIVQASNASSAFPTTNHRREHNLLADAKSRNFCADLCDLSGNVAAWNVGKRYGNIRQSAAHPQIEMI
jgi:hypothetical protein